MTGAHQSPRAWLTIQEASDLLGVSPATLRRWTQAGDLEAFVTPGGHRRFDRTSVLALLPSGPKRRRRLAELGETPERVVLQYRREIRERPATDGFSALREDQREAFREPGRRILTGILGFLDAPTPAESEASIADALDAARQYGALGQDFGFGVEILTETFLRFRLPFLDELGRIARRRRLDADEAMDLILAASRAFDRLLIGLLRGHAGLPAVAEPAHLGHGGLVVPALGEPGPHAPDPGGPHPSLRPDVAR